MRRNMIILGAIIALLGFTVFQYMSDSKQEMIATSAEEAPRIGYFAPSFDLAKLDGEPRMGVSGERDKPLLLNFWASWCGPCELEAPDLVYLHQKHGEKLDVYAVNATFSDSIREVESFVDKHGFQFPVLMDTEGTVSKRYNARGFPMTFLIDRNGVIHDVILGVLPRQELEKKVKKLLAYR